MTIFDATHFILQEIEIEEIACVIWGGAGGMLSLFVVKDPTASLSWWNRGKRDLNFCLGLKEVQNIGL